MTWARATAGVGLLLAAQLAGVAGAQPLPEPSAPEQGLPEQPLPEQPASDAARREEARTLGYSGVRAYGNADYAAASEQLERSFALLPVPSLGLWSARALAKLSKLVEAEQRYRAVAKMRVAADDSDVQHAARETAQAELLELLPRIPSVRVQVAGAPAEQVAITLDGSPLPIERWRRGEPVNPGRHQIAGTSPVGERALLEIIVSEGRESEALLTFVARPLASGAEVLPGVARPNAVVVPGAALPSSAAAPPLATPNDVALSGAAPAGSEATSARAWQLGAWIAVGAAGVSLGTSAVSYFLARDQQQELEANGLCRGRLCQPSAGLDRYDNLRSAQIVTLVGALALGAAGATILILEPGEPEAGALATSGLRLRLGLGSAALSGQF